MADVLADEAEAVRVATAEILARERETVTRLARAAAIRQLPLEAAPGESDLITRLARHPQAARIWAELAQSLSQRARRGKAVNLDPAALLMDMVLKLEETAGSLAHR